jgi:hypothetical protein
MAGSRAAKQHGGWKSLEGGEGGSVKRGGCALASFWYERDGVLYLIHFSLSLLVIDGIGARSEVVLRDDLKVETLVTFEGTEPLLSHPALI